MVNLLLFASAFVPSVILILPGFRQLNQHVNTSEQNN